MTILESGQLAPASEDFSGLNVAVVGIA